MACLLPLLAVGVALAGPYGDLRKQARDEDRLVPGSTGTLLGLVEESICERDYEPVDCAALRTPIPRPEPGEEPLVELVPVPGWLVPPMAGGEPALLVPAFPYGDTETVIPVLGRPLPLHLSPEALLARIDVEGDRWTRATGSVRVRLLTSPPQGTVGLPPEELPTGPDGHSVYFELLPRAARVSRGAEEPVALSCPGPEPPRVGARLSEQDARHLRDRLRLASGICLRDARGRWQREAWGQSRGWFSPPPEIPDPEGRFHVVVRVDPSGAVNGAALTGAPWNDPDLDRCLLVNARKIQVDPLPAAPESLPAAEPPPGTSSPPLALARYAVLSLDAEGVIE